MGGEMNRRIEIDIVKKNDVPTNDKIIIGRFMNSSMLCNGTELISLVVGKDIYDFYTNDLLEAIKNTTYKYKVNYKIDE
jgi:hypothetical protein